MHEIETFKNGKWIPNSEVGISEYDAHFMYGVAAFESVRTFGYKLFLLNEHIDRLYRSIAYLGFSINLTKLELKACCEKTINHNVDYFDNDEMRMMIHISPGILPIYEKYEKSETSWQINLNPQSMYAERVVPLYNTGVNAVIVSQLQMPDHIIDARVKHTNRIHLWLAEKEASHFGENAHAVLLDEFGNITEGAGSNIVFVKNGILKSPNRNILEGETLKYLLNIANDLGYKVERGTYKSYDLIDADEAFMCNTWDSIVPISKITFRGITHIIKDNNPFGNVTLQILNEWSKQVNVDIANQYRKWYVQR